MKTCIHFTNQNIQVLTIISYKEITKYIQQWLKCFPIFIVKSTWWQLKMAKTCSRRQMNAQCSKSSDRSENKYKHWWKINYTHSLMSSTVKVLLINV
jgi:hypothetical protein